MILTNEENVVINPADNINKIDGSYYGIICNVILSNNGLISGDDNRIFSCSIYIPEVYGLYKNNYCNYPVVEIPFKQDLDDVGYVPQIGDICKVMFEDGKSYTCKLIHMLYIREENRLINENYIKYGILPYALVEKPDNPEYYNKFSGEFLNFAYFVTTGHWKDSVTVNDFDFGVIGPPKDDDTGTWFGFKIKGISAATNYFCHALGMPFMSYLVYQDPAYFNVPINSTPIYNVVDIITKMIDKTLYEPEDITKYFTESKYDFEAIRAISPYKLYQEYKNEEAMLAIIFSVLCIISPRYYKILHSGFNIPDNILRNVDGMYPLGGRQYNYSEVLWNSYNDPSLKDIYSYLAYSEFLYKYREQYELNWIQTMIVYMSGLNELTKNINTKYTFLYCLTICPYLAYPLFLQRIETPELIEEINNQLEKQGKQKADFRNYSTYISSDTKFTEVSIQLRDLIQSTLKPNEIVSKFRDIAYSLFKDSNIYIHFDYKDGWTFSKMDEKFDRLKNNIESELSKLTIL